MIIEFFSNSNEKVSTFSLPQLCTKVAPAIIIRFPARGSMHPFNFKPALELLMDSGALT